MKEQRELGHELGEGGRTCGVQGALPVSETLPPNRLAPAIPSLDSHEIPEGPNAEKRWRRPPNVMRVA